MTVGHTIWAGLYKEPDGSKVSALGPVSLYVQRELQDLQHERSQVNEEQNRADKRQRTTIKGGGGGKFKASMRRYVSTCWARMLWSSLLQAVTDAGALDTVSADRNLRRRNTISEQAPPVSYH